MRQELHPHHTRIGDDGLVNLQGLKSLTTLDVFDTRITDAGREHLAEWMARLEWLELSDTHVSDTGLRSLRTGAGTTGLWTVYLGLG